MQIFIAFSTENEEFAIIKNGHKLPSNDNFAPKISSTEGFLIPLLPQKRLAVNAHPLRLSRKSAIIFDGNQNVGKPIALLYAMKQRTQKMSGVITKKHFFQIWKAFNLKVALRILTSREPVALLTLIS
jgi:hypothetical protein